jgi:hypothetical protein
VGWASGVGEGWLILFSHWFTLECSSSLYWLDIKALGLPG